MLIAPSSIVKILKNVPLDNKYKHTIYFSDTGSQTSYFASKYKYNFSDCYYIREEKKLRVNTKADNLFDCNYLMYQNPSYGTKWFYAFITKVEYINDTVCYVNFEIDVMQTWLVNYDYQIKQSFVEREHVSRDVVGENLVDEKLEIGSYIIADRTGTVASDGNMTDISYLVGVSDLSPLGGSTTDPIANVYGHLFSGLKYFAYTESDWTGLQSFIQTYIEAGKTDAIVFICAIPSFLVGYASGGIGTTETVPSLTVGLSKPYNDIDGYVPRNKKLFNYPYNTLYVTNNQGVSAEFRYEDFKNAIGQPEILFGIIGHISPNPTLQCCPINYKGGSSGYTGMNTEYALSMTGYPLCSWTDDVFKAWLAKNDISTGVGVVAGLGALIGGVATANVGAVAGGAMAVHNQMSQFYRASLQPDQAKGNTTAGSLNIATGRQEFYFQKMQIRAEFARKIDDFFTMFGYKINELKIPNLSTRPHWNYVKTIDICLIGSVPADDMEKIQGIYNNGVTFWKNGNEVGDYSLDNSFA
jgi:hypothetical protein